MIDCWLDGKVLNETSGCRIVYCESKVVKTGRRVTLDESTAMKMGIELGLPVPRVNEAGTAYDEVFIQMDYIPGDCLDTVWPSMTEKEKKSICEQLRAILTSMRSIPWRTNVVGSCLGGAARDCRQYNDYHGGPYRDEETFNSAFYFDLVDTVPGPIRTALSRQLRSDHRIVFSHGDLAQHNIIVKDGQIKALLDWEYAGWYPEYWDYIKFFERPCVGDWKNRAEEIFPQSYDKELASHQAILRWQRP